MKHHSASQQDEFPFSITSSIEKGALNRYDNIWPYEYSRVKLHENNYINANHVQFSSIKENITASPLQKTTQQLKLEDQGLLSEASLRTMTKKRTQDLASTRPYICTQGPLPTTFADFWKMIWDEQVPVIVMLTQEFELNKVYFLIQKKMISCTHKMILDQMSQILARRIRVLWINSSDLFI